MTRPRGAIVGDLLSRADPDGDPWPELRRPLSQYVRRVLQRFRPHLIRIRTRAERGEQ